MLIAGIFKDADSTIPDEEFPIIKLQCFDIFKNKSCPQFLIILNLFLLTYRYDTSKEECPSRSNTT